VARILTEKPVPTFSNSLQQKPGRRITPQRFSVDLFPDKRIFTE